MTRFIGFVTGPALFIIILFLVPDTFISSGANKVLALASWMIIWWVAEAVPIPVTALLPLIVFPFLGVMKMSEAAEPYANPIIFLFMGGFMIALALEKHRLHERIALNLIRITGTSGNGIILGFMIATGFISMWISNTATAMMMLPIGLSVINLLLKNKQTIHELPKAERNFALGLMLMIGYASSLGGLGTIIGTPPNVVFKGLLEKFYNQQIAFGQWMLVGVPVAIILLVFTHLMITRLLFPNRLAKIEGSDQLLTDKLTEMGKLTSEEKKVLTVFCLTSFFWIFQEAFNTYLFSANILNDTNVAMTGGLLMFLIPVNTQKKEFLLDWKDTKQMQWGILILFGGGLCLAEGLERTGIIQHIGAWIATQSTFNVALLGILIITGVALSELMSNVALVQIFVPVIFGIANGLEANPVLLAMPVVLSASIGFMFPIATPPNAIVFSSGYIRMQDMMRAGILLDLMSILIILLASITLIPWVFG
ncbi:MAG TPA: DASS family sodium-coupled anion symporter [Ohtaekwangia sp.]